MSFKTQTNKLLAGGRGLAARKLIRAELRSGPADHWLMVKMAQSYAIEDELRLALRWVERAIELEPRCPTAMWNLAGILFRLRRDRESERVLRVMIARGTGGVTRAKKACRQSLRWARGQMANCQLLLSWILADRKDLRGARRAVRCYLKARAAGAPSAYRVTEGRAQLKKVEQALALAIGARR